jgi:Protein of unknown function (DUF998)
MEIMAKLSLASGLLSLLCLLALHFVSPEFQPSWRMVSEYALGKNKGLLTAFFLLWGLSSILLSVVLWKNVGGVWASLGVVLLFVSGIGAIMGGLFDVNHKWHGLAFAFGVPTPIVGSLLIAYHLVKLEGWSAHRMSILLSTHAVWFSCVLMAVSMAVMFSGFKAAGIAVGPDAAPPKEVPPGVIALGGYANRFLVFCYQFWAMLHAYLFLKH